MQFGGIWLFDIVYDYHQLLVSVFPNNAHAILVSVSWLCEGQKEGAVDAGKWNKCK